MMTVARPPGWWKAAHRIPCCVVDYPATQFCRERLSWSTDIRVRIVRGPMAGTSLLKTNASSSRVLQGPGHPTIGTAINSNVEKRLMTARDRQPVVGRRLVKFDRERNRHSNRRWRHEYLHHPPGGRSTSCRSIPDGRTGQARRAVRYGRETRHRRLLRRAAHPTTGACLSHC